jgi:hypothetical protein
MAFPTSVEEATFFQVAANNCSTILTQTLGIADSTAYVATTTNWPSVGWLTVEDEVRYYTGKTANTFTGCVPGSSGTVAAEHAVSTAVSLTPGAEPWNNIVVELRAAQTAIGTTAAPNLVKNTGNETIAGIKTFSSSPIVPTPTTDMQASTKKYVDDNGVAGGVTITGAQTITGAKTFHKTVQTIVTATDGATVTFDLALGNHQTVILGGNRTLALSNDSLGQCFIIKLIQDGTGTRTVTWFTTIHWGNNTAPTLTTTANRYDVFGFACHFSGHYDGFIIGQNMV